MPIHSLEAVHVLVQAGRFGLATSKCRANVQSLGLSRNDVARMLMAVTRGDHRKEFGPADTDFGEVQTDAYLLHYDDDEKRRCRPGSGFAYYLKFGIAENYDGELCVVASFHLSS